MALLANVNRDPKKSKAFTAKDFSWDKEKKQKDVALTDDEIYNMLRTAFPPQEDN